MNLTKPIYTNLIPVLLTMGLYGCGDDNLDPNAINAPNTYEFESHFSPGESSVDFTNSSTTLLLIQEVDHLLSSSYLQEYGALHGKEETLSLINRVYELGNVEGNSGNLSTTNIYDEESTSPTPISGIELDESSDYSQLPHQISLKNALMEVNETMDVADIQWMDDLVQSSFNRLSELASDSNEQTNYYYQLVDHKTRVISFLKAAIPYHQVTNILLSDAALTVDNDAPMAGKNYSQLEHNWDLAFGLSGSIVNLKLLEPSEIVSRYSQSWPTVNDALHNRTDSIMFEAALRDSFSPLSSTSLALDIQQQFLNGRTIIQAMQKTSIPEEEIELTQQLTDVRNNLFYTWERGLVSALFSYLNATANLSTTPDNTDYMIVWSQLYAYARVLSINPNKTLSSDLIADLRSAIGTRPHDNKGTSVDFRVELFKVRNQIASEFNIEEDVYLSW